MYADDYFQNDIEHQDPLELVRLLYMKAIAKLGESLEHLEAGRIPERAAAVAHAQEIVVELQAALDTERGGEIADNLAALYAYIQVRLTEGNAQQQAEPLEEVRGLLSTLLEGWSACESETAETKIPAALADEEVQSMTADLSRARHAWTL